MGVIIQSDMKRLITLKVESTLDKAYIRKLKYTERSPSLNNKIH